MTKPIRSTIAACSLALAFGVAQARGQEDPPLPDPAPEEDAAPLAQPLAYSTDARTIRLVPLRPGRLPDLAQGQVLSPMCGAGVDPRRPPAVHWLPNGDLLVIQHAPQDGWQRFVRDVAGRLRAGPTGAWPRGWSYAGAGYLDGDDGLDLVVFRKAGDGYAPFEVHVAAGLPDGAFDLSPRAPVRVLERQWAATFAVADMDGDGWADLVFHAQPHGASHPVEMFFLRGQGNGGFERSAERRLLLRGRMGATTAGITLDDFDGDGRVDVLLPPDDDVPDAGQAQLALAGRQPVDSVDFRPDDEGWTNDEGSYQVQTCDVDLDRRVDLIVWYYAWRGDAFSVRVHRGDGRGGFGAAETLLEGQVPNPYKPHMAWRLAAVEW